jgi:cardiolipin synthase (CMP-forming)
MKKNINKFEFTLANKITVLRLVLTPVTVICLLIGAMPWFYGLFVFSAFTDLLDGLAARLRGERTLIGAFLDPIADKLFLFSVYLAMTFMRIIDVWLFVVVFSRDLIIVLGWAVIYILTRSASIQPRLLGKITTFIQMACVPLFTWPGLPESVRQGCIWTIVVLTAASVVDYVLVGEKKLGSWES